MVDLNGQDICVVHIGKDGDLNYLFSGNAVFLIIDERAPYDRVFQMTQRTPKEVIVELVGSGQIGNCHDVRHAAIARRIEHALQGRKHLEIVSDGGDGTGC